MLDNTLVDGPSRIHVQHDDETRLSLTEAQSVVDLNAIQPEMNGQSKQYTDQAPLTSSTRVPLRSNLWRYMGIDTSVFIACPNLPSMALLGTCGCII